MAKHPLFCFTAYIKNTRSTQNRQWTGSHRESLQNGAEGSHLCLRQSSSIWRCKSCPGYRREKFRRWKMSKRNSTLSRESTWEEDFFFVVTRDWRDTARHNWSSLSSIVPPSCLAPPINNALETGSPALVWTAIMHDTTHSAFIPLQCKTCTKMCLASLQGHCGTQWDYLLSDKQWLLHWAQFITFPSLSMLSETSNHSVKFAKIY